MTNPFKNAVGLLSSWKVVAAMGSNEFTINRVELEAIITALSAMRGLADGSEVIVPADYPKTVMRKTAQLICPECSKHDPEFQADPTPTFWHEAEECKANKIHLNIRTIATVSPTTLEEKQSFGVDETSRDFYDADGSDELSKQEKP